jgi:glycosyltransferase involved in cell wall biosynthesis
MTPPKKIALIVPGGFGTGKNNLGIPVLEQIVQLLSNHFEVTVFQLFQVNKGYEANGFRLLEFKSRNKIVKYLSFAVAFWRENKKNEFAAVHGFWAWPCGFLAVVLGKILGIKSIVSVLGGDAASLPELAYGHLRKFFNRKIILWTLENCNEPIALTNYLAKNLFGFGLKRNLIIIPWGVDQQLFNFQPRKLQVPVRFLNVANLSPVKDQGMLLRAFKIINQTIASHLTIIGEGAEEQNIKNLIDHLQLQQTVTLSGHLPYHQLPGYYHNADVLLHTSKSEGQSEVVTEAMSCGTLVAGTKVGLIHDFPEFCVCVEVGDFAALATEVIELLNDAQRMKDHIDRGHKWNTEHSVHWTASQMMKLY